MRCGGVNGVKDLIDFIEKVILGEIMICILDTSI